MDKKEFYDKCSVILNIEHFFNEPPFRRTRWNNRNLSNGRFKGYGLVQYFGSFTRIITKKHGTLMFYEVEKVFEFLEKDMEVRTGVVSGTDC